MNNEYIIITGAPGSKWSSVVKNIYWSSSIDQSDYSKERTYCTPGTKQLMHIGAYWDPGMEFRATRDNWDLPFSGTGKRLIKSHTFVYELDHLKDLGYPIVMVYRNDVECIEWWKKCGHFNITYPNYAPYYKDLANMWNEIQKQNCAIMQFVKNNLAKIHQPDDNIDLCEMLNLECPDEFVCHTYKEKDIKVYVYEI